MAKSRSKISRQPVKKSKRRRRAARVRPAGQKPARHRPRRPRRRRANGSMPSAAARRRAAPACAICSAARARASPKWRSSAFRCRPASPSPPRSAPISTPTAKPIRRICKPQVEAALAEVGRITGKKFGDGENPLLVSVRSGARASMPGMMDTVLNLGLNDATVAALAEKSGDQRFAYDSYRRFITMYSDVVLGIAAPSLRGNPRRAQGPQRLHARHRSRRRRLGATGRAIQGTRRGGDRQAVPAGPARAVVGRDRRRVRLVDEPARHHLSAPARHSGKLGHRGQRAGHGVRQHGRDVGDRRRLHPQSVDRREEVLRRISDQCPGRGRGRRHPHAAGDHRGGAQGGGLQQAVDGNGDAAGLRRAQAHLHGAGKALPRHAGPRIHGGAGQAVDAADAQRQTHRQGRAAHRRRAGAGETDHQGRKR